MSKWVVREATIGDFDAWRTVFAGVASEGIWRRENGELWDLLVMGPVLGTGAPGSPHVVERR